jgi:hypothetical protein
MGVRNADASVFQEMLNEVTEKMRQLAADPAGMQKMQEMCELFLEYHKFGPYESGEVARFPTIPEEALDQLTAVCIEFSSSETWQKAIKLLHETSDLMLGELQADLTTKAMGRLLYRTGANEESVKNAEEPIACL